jgi:CelD/BcsL family acetyltransferase involved in cellulose biosynthesis
MTSSVISRTSAGRRLGAGHDNEPSGALYDAERSMTRKAPHPATALVTSIDDLELIADEWNRLAARCASPFLTADWLLSWSTAYQQGTPAIHVLRDGRGRLIGGLACARRGGWLSSASNEQSGNWGAIALDVAGREAVWAWLSATAPPRVRLTEMMADDARVATRHLAAQGFHLMRRTGARSPYLTLPENFETLAASVSRNLRSQVVRRRRALENAGDLRLRTVTGGEEAEIAFEHVLRLEAAGWKGRQGTAMLADPGLLTLHRTFARRAASRGWLRLYLLELDGELIAADYGCSFADQGFLLKTTYDERYHHLSPGLVLRAEVLRACIEEGLRSYDFLGGSEAYKLRWTSEIRARVSVTAYRGRATLPERLYRSRVRPRLKRVHARVLAGGWPNRGRGSTQSPA